MLSTEESRTGRCRECRRLVWTHCRPKSIYQKSLYSKLFIKSRTFQVLQVLVENAGNVVTKEDFFEKVWQGAFVEDNNLTVAVAEIRKILGETKENKFIETDLAKGYISLGENDKAIEWLAKGVEARVPDMLSIKYAPAFDSLKTDIRFQAILAKMNFPN